MPKCDFNKAACQSVISIMLQSNFSCKSAAYFQNNFLQNNKNHEFITAGKQTIAIHILLNIGRSKGNQSMKLGQLIKCEIKNDFVKESYTKCCGVAGPFLKSQN